MVRGNLLFFAIFMMIITGHQVKGQNQGINDPKPNPEDTVYHKVSQPPHHPGARKGLRSYIDMELNYPEKAVKDSTEGTTTIRFIVTKKGFITRIQIVDSLCPTIHSAIKEAFQNMPRWEPGLVKGDKVHAWRYLPIRFNLVED